jgi:hypothetical protein
VKEPVAADESTARRHVTTPLARDAETNGARAPPALCSSDRPFPYHDESVARPRRSRPRRSQDSRAASSTGAVRRHAAVEPAGQRSSGDSRSPRRARLRRRASLALTRRRRPEPSEVAALGDLAWRSDPYPAPCSKPVADRGGRACPTSGACRARADLCARARKRSAIHSGGHARSRHDGGGEARGSRASPEAAADGGGEAPGSPGAVWRVCRILAAAPARQGLRATCAAPPRPRSDASHRRQLFWATSVAEAWRRRRPGPASIPAPSRSGSRTRRSA